MEVVSPPTDCRSMRLEDVEDFGVLDGEKNCGPFRRTTGRSVFFKTELPFFAALNRMKRNHIFDFPLLSLFYENDR